MKLKSSPVKLKALELGLPVETPEKARDPEFVEKIKAIEADVHVVAAYGQILSTKLLETAKRGGINLHGSILPEYRGAAPIQRAIMDGKTETGVTLMQMDKGMDTGDMIDIVRTPIDPDETYGELHTRLAQLAAQQIEDWIERIAEGTYSQKPQNHELATYAPKITPEERVVNFGTPASHLYNQFRGLSPSPGMYLQTQSGKVKLVEIKPVPQDAFFDSGSISSLDPTIATTSEGGIELCEVCPEGRKTQSGAEWLRGLASRIGTNINDL